MLHDHASPLQRLFNKTAQHVLDSKWTVFSQFNNWHEILPCPDLSIQSQTPMSALVMKAAGLHKESLHEQKLKWALLATDFFNHYKEHINRSVDTMERHLTDELAVWNKHHTEKNEQLSPEKMYREWLATIHHLSLKEFTELSIGLNTAHQFLTPKYEVIKERYGISTDTKRAPRNLTLRQIALLHIYQDKLINRSLANQIAQHYGHKSGEKLYKHYIKHTRTSDRTGIEGKQIDPVLKDINAIIHLLNERQKQQAESEIKTIKAKLSDQS